MKHRHIGNYRSRTPRGRIVFKRRPLHVQTLIFSKPTFNRKKAIAWAKKHKFKYYTSRETEDTIRVRQFPPKQITQVGGTFKMGKDVKAVYTKRRNYGGLFFPNIGTLKKDHEGRHRAKAAEMAGVKKIPVNIVEKY